MGKFTKGQKPWNTGLPKEKQPAFNKKCALGNKHSEETKQKISESLKQQWKDGNRTTDHLRTEESKNKVVASLIGRKISDETKKKLSYSHSKEKHYRWNQDRKSVKHDRRNDGEYKQWRKEVRKRDRNICQLKDDTCSEKIITHHIIPWSINTELRYCVENGIVLCSNHHPKKRQDELEMIKTLQDIITMKY